MSSAAVSQSTCQPPATCPRTSQKTPKVNLLYIPSCFQLACTLTGGCGTRLDTTKFDPNTNDFLFHDWNLDDPPATDPGTLYARRCGCTCMCLPMCSVSFSTHASAPTISRPILTHFISRYTDTRIRTHSHTRTYQGTCQNIAGFGMKLKSRSRNWCSL